MLASFAALVALAALPSPGVTAMTEPERRRAFAFRLYRAIAQSQTSANLCVSPLSVQMAFELLGQGSGGESDRLLRAALGVDGTWEQAAAAAKLLRSDLGKDPLTFSMANGIWHRSDFQPLPLKVEKLQDQYGAAFRPFSSPGQALGEVNRFVKETTRGRIPSILEQVDDSASLILVNALAFDGEWAVPFSKEETEEIPFRPTTGDAKAVPFLSARERRAMYLESPEAQAIALPYKGNACRLLLILPPVGQSPAALIEKLGPEGLARIQSSLTGATVNLAFPKFKATQTIMLREPMERMGLGPLFSKIDLGGFAPELATRQQISEAIHKTFLEWDEVGTRGAAATAIGIRATSMPVNVKTFVADRPFAYVLEHASTGAIVFMGTVDRF